MTSRLVPEEVGMAGRVPLTGGEKESLLAALERHRDAVLWKFEAWTTLRFADQ
jgi:hypothetical protein